jgi:pentatricopeptide repeat protein
MRDYDEEPAMLRELNTLLESSVGLVTFNGRSFDWNLLYTRFVQNRIKPVVKEPINIDLLFPARRIWSLSLESCRLASLEENVLEEYRTDDIPGAMIPAVYFDYLSSGDTSEITRVIRHNELDILSMVALMTRMSSMLENPKLDSPCFELLGVGRILNIHGNQRFEACYEACAKSENYSVKAMASKQLSDFYKKAGNYEKALEYWKDMAESANGFFLDPLVEMAKYYEHREKNYIKALEIVECAMSAISEAGLTRGREFLELRKRQQRLTQKASKLKAIN